MEQKVKYMKQNKKETVLEKIGIPNKEVNQWKSAGLKISYPMKAQSSFLRSMDGFFVYAADRFVPPLSKREIEEYIKNPSKFRKVFLKNLRFYTKFYESLFPLIRKTEKLKNSEKTAALLSLLHLFQSAMDHHYYHYDRYLAYENYPQTPVGYWWKKLKILYTKATGKKFSRLKPSKDFLSLLSQDPEILKMFKKKLSKNDFIELKRVLKIIKMFERTQEDESRIFYGTHLKESKLLMTGFTIWNNLCDTIRNNPDVLKKRHISNIEEIMKCHPIVGIRKLLHVGLKYFDKEVISQFETEIKKWL